MNLVEPMQLAWAAAIVVIVLLYVRWAKRTARRSTTLPIWEHALARRTLWSRWRRTVSVLAACVPIVLIALAMARPAFTPAVRQSRSIIVVVDNTASMNAPARGRTRLEQAKRAARRLVSNLRVHDRIAILSADSAVRTRCGLTGDRTVLHLALDQIQPTDGAGGMSRCIATARRLAAGESRPVVIVISDMAFDVDAPTRDGQGDRDREGDDVVWMPVGGASRNLAITRLAAEPSTSAEGSHAVLVEVANFGSEPAQADVELALGDTPVATLDFAVAAGEKSTRIASANVTEAGLLTAKLQGQDDLPADNSAALLVAPALKRRVVLLSTRESSPLETVLAGLPGISLDKRPSSPQEMPAGAVLVFDGAVPARLPSAPILVVGTMDSTDLWQAGGTLARPQAAAAAPHPLLRGVDLRDVIIDAAPSLRFDNSAQVLARTSGGAPLYTLVPRPGGHVLVLGFSDLTSDLAEQDDFPRLIAQAIAWLSQTDAALPGQWSTTDTLVLSKDNNKERKLLSPYGDAVAPVDGRAPVANLLDAGLWQVTDGEGVLAAVAPVNLAGEESDLNARTSDLNHTWPHVSWWPEFGPLWMLLAAAALVWVAGHWGFYQRGSID